MSHAGQLNVAGEAKTPWVLDHDLDKIGPDNNSKTRRILGSSYSAPFLRRRTNHINAISPACTIHAGSGAHIRLITTYKKTVFLRQVSRDGE